MNVRLGISSGFAINRYPEPEDWLRIVGKELGIRYVQFTADLLNPFLPKKIIDEQIERLLKAAKKYNVKFDSSFTSQFTRVNHLCHPDPKQREIWVKWFKKWLTITARLGARGGGSHYGILPIRAMNDKPLYNKLVKSAAESWRELAVHAKKIGLDWLIYEPMSVPRELGDTIGSSIEIMDMVNRGNKGVPFLMCLDVDHGNAFSGDPRDIDPYEWLRRCGKYSPIIHIKQSIPGKGHIAFTPENNRLGKIKPDKVMEALKAGGVEDAVLTIEVAHRERLPQDYQVVSDLKVSTKFWRRFVKE